ncbi:MAG: hypothetical protein EOP83_10455 [Verrucomicrobiaceae bacterium]|nr:MAG: hypothetical protein EOP83_10455 [Verrucomicrobiaceae bacterium]
MLWMEGASLSYKESKVVPYGTVIEGEAYTVQIPGNGLYVMRRDRSKDGITIGDSAGGFEGFQYVVFRTDSPAGETPSTALLRHFNANAAGDGWRLVRTHKGVAKGSAGQVDLHTPRGRGFVAVTECFRRGSQLWVVARMQPMFRTSDAEITRQVEDSRSSLKRFAASFRWK